ncbi:cation:proton antiporter [Streptomyces sp. NPDC012888]|uniref:cation:proton antiporter n=1 Tax=Streptomyces sp. NPDC012888 TaxID=3364855 RepID=UPI00369484B0
MSPDAMVFHLAAATAVILVVAHAAAGAARWLGQPVVIGQLIGGIALGPTVLGAVAPGLARELFPPGIAPVLGGLSQTALIAFLFCVGCELDLTVLRRRARTVLGVSSASFLVPMAAGAGLALLLEGPFVQLGAPAGMPAPAVLFAGVALSVTAVPVLAAVLRHNGLTGTSPGVIALAAAGLTDLVGWSVLTALMLDGGPGGGGWAVRLMWLLLFTVAMVLFVRPLLRRLFGPGRPNGPYRVGLVIAFAGASAWVTDTLGLHVIFGAFLAGVVMPRDGGARDQALLRPLHEVSGVLLPFFFVVSGSHVAVGSLDAGGVAVCVLVTALAITTKVASGTVAARLSGVARDDARTIGVLLSTRGLTELIALDAGRQAGLVGGLLYTVFVLMALATTLATQPLLGLVRRLSTPPPPKHPTAPPPPQPHPPDPTAPHPTTGPP